MSKTGETVTFEYNEDGLRTKKTSTSKGVTEYTLHGKNIVHLTRGNQSLHFFYDGQGNREYFWKINAYFEKDYIENGILFKNKFFVPSFSNEPIIQVEIPVF